MPALTELVDGLIHEPTQTEGPGLDLTVDRVVRLVGPGAVDFGGDEYESAPTEPIDPECRDPDDDYGWWELPAGTYLLKYNETLIGDRTVLLQPRPAITGQGITHPTLQVDSLPMVPVTVPSTGTNLKENARVSRLFATGNSRSK